MLIPVIAFWAMSAPAGYLAGDVYLSHNDLKYELLPWLTALLPPLGAVFVSAQDDQ